MLIKYSQRFIFIEKLLGDSVRNLDNVLTEKISLIWKGFDIVDESAFAVLLRLLTLLSGGFFI